MGTSQPNQIAETQNGDEQVEGSNGRGNWRHAAFHVATTIATPAAYAPLPFAMASLGWPAGAVSLVSGTVVTWYSSLLVASLWKWDGYPHNSYRELARSIFGLQGYWAVTFFQQVASVGNNIAIQIAAGSSLKAIYKYYHKTGTLTLQEFIIIFGVFELLLSQFPDIHSLRWVNAICTLSTVGFAGTAIGVTLYAGKHLDRESVDYQLHGTSSTKIYTAFNALGTIAFSFGDAMLPEIQSTLRPPAKKNMYKGVSAAYLIIVVTYWQLAFTGYWAFGSAVEPYILSSLTTPAWPIVMANVFAVLQSKHKFHVPTSDQLPWSHHNRTHIIGTSNNCAWLQVSGASNTQGAQHTIVPLFLDACTQFYALELVIYCRPTYTYFEERMMQTEKGAFVVRNCITRFFLTSIYIALITFIAAAIPFFGDFVALCGAIGFTPLDFVLPSLVFLKVGRKPRNKLFYYCIWALNIAIIVWYSMVAILGSIGAIRFIVVDTKTYKAFHNM